MKDYTRVIEELFLENNLFKGSNLNAQEKYKTTEWFLKLNDEDKDNMLKLVDSLKDTNTGIYIVGSAAKQRFTSHLEPYDSSKTVVVNKTPNDIDIVYVNPRIRYLYWNKNSKGNPILSDETMTKLQENLVGKLTANFQEINLFPYIETYMQNQDARAIITPEQGKQIDVLIESNEFNWAGAHALLYSNTSEYEKRHDMSERVILYRN